MGARELQPINTSRAETIITTSDAASLWHATAVFKSSGGGGGGGEELFGYTERNLITSSEMFAAGIRFWETITKKTEKHNSFIQGDGVLCWF